MSSLQNYIQDFNRLKCAKSVKHGEAPHKPVLLLAIIEMATQGRLKTSQIFIGDDLKNSFMQMWCEHVRSSHYQPDLGKPFYHMKNEPFWRLKARPGFENELENKNKMKHLNSLNKAVEYAEIETGLWRLLQNSMSREALRAFLLARYFNKTEPLSPDCTSSDSACKPPEAKCRADNPPLWKLLQDSMPRQAANDENGFIRLAA